jgi:Acetyltransferase (GNAT) domain
MDLGIRPIDAAEWERFCRTMAVAYGSGDDGEDADLAPHVEYDRTLAAFDGDQIVATAGAFSLPWREPGGYARCGRARWYAPTPCSPATRPLGRPRSRCRSPSHEPSYYALSGVDSVL